MHLRPCAKVSDIPDYEFGEPEPIRSRQNAPSMHDQVINELVRRKYHGMTKYETILQGFNGRNSLRDALEEILDLSVYLQQKLYEEENLILLVSITHDGRKLGTLKIFSDSVEPKDELADYTVEMTVERGGDVVSTHRRTLRQFPRNSINSMGLLKAALALFDTEAFGLDDDFDRDKAEDFSTVVERGFARVMRSLQGGES